MNRYKLSIIIPTYNQADKITIGFDSIPAEPLIETIVINDGSTDDTFEVVHQYIADHPEKDIKLIGWWENRGVQYACNAGYDHAKGEYMVILGSDGDYFLPGVLDRAVFEWLDGTDLVFFDIKDNTGHVRKLRPATVAKYPGSTKFMRRAFVGNIRCPVERRRAEDVVFTRQLLTKRPTMRFTNTVVKHYNYPREGSLTWNARHGVTNSIGFPVNE